MAEKPDGDGERDTRPTRATKPAPKSRSRRVRRDMLEAQYVENVRLDVRVADKRAQQDVRKRRDGTPSAAPPHPVLPLSNWATVQDAPDGGEYTPAERLRAYREWLIQLKRNGLYDGPTELKRVNDEE